MTLDANPHSRKVKSYLYRLVIAFLLAFALLGTYLFDQRPSHVSNETVTLFANQNNDDLSSLFTSAIQEAKESVLLIVYTLSDKRIIQALKSKSEEGVYVHVISDAIEAPFVTRKLGSNVSVSRRFSEGRMHEKILVIDNEESWIGSANMTSASLHMHGNLVTRLKNIPLSSRIQHKALTMNVEGDVESQPRDDFLIGGQSIEMWFLPNDHRPINRIKNLIQTAKKSIRIAMFTWTRTDFAHEVINAANRGINVEVVLDRKQGKGASSKIVKLLKASKVKLSLSRGASLLHHKFLYIDSSTLVNGSANWTLSAFAKNDECFIVIHKLVPRQREQMDTLWDVISQESTAVNDR